MKCFLSLTRTVVTQGTSSVLAVIDLIDQNTTTRKKRRTSNGQTTESDPAQILELYQPSGLAGIHDQTDEENRQQAILISRFYNHLAAQQMPEDIIRDLVDTKFQKMQYNETMTPVPWDED